MKKILVLDDLPDICKILKLVLEKNNYEVETFTNGFDAIEYVKNNRVDLVILDIRLAKMTGIEAFKKMKVFQPDLKAIILTGYPTIETARDALKLGISEYCVKPLEQKNLLEAITRILPAE